METAKEALTRWGLRVNWKKSKVLRVVRKREKCQVMIEEETQ